MKKQYEGNSETVVQASPEAVWAVLEDSRLLPQWAPMVKQTTGTIERPGTTRRCVVEWNGRTDHVTERCIEAVVNRRIAWAMEEGAMLKMFSKIHFWYELKPDGLDRTILSLGFCYEPRHLIARIMYVLMMERTLTKLRATLLDNVRKLAEAGVGRTVKANES